MHQQDGLAGFYGVKREKNVIIGGYSQYLYYFKGMWLVAEMNLSGY